ncbi:metallophosphoesterase [Aquibacillus sediminis]|uniref:metallophosphoesterase n=1 Tax=Aquibacillus sediminis TaxID=2574734 RepID=UPI001107C884|nr:metallophosphoesterase [Aquibacillus sediminis]
MILFIILLLICIALLGFMWYKAFDDHIDYRTVHVKSKLMKPVTLFFISDIHKRKIKKKTMRQIKERIDLVVIGGDLLEKGVDFRKVKKNLLLLHSCHAPIYFVWGNNDYEVNSLELEQLLQNHGVHVLRDKTVTINHGTTTINLIGLDYRKEHQANLDPLLMQATGDIQFLIAHDPNAFYSFTNQQAKQIDFVMSGHTHGGQIRVFGHGFYARGGLETYLNTPILVSEGYGYTKVPLRLGTNAQCHIITVN